MIDAELSPDLSAIQTRALLTENVPRLHDTLRSVSDRSQHKT